MKSCESFIFYFGYSTSDEEEEEQEEEEKEEEEELSGMQMSLHRWTHHNHLDKL